MGEHGTILEISQPRVKEKHMNTQENITYFYNDCQVDINDEHTMEVIGSYRILATVEPGRGELDQAIELAEIAGQQIKINLAATSLEKLDRRAAKLAQEVSPQRHKHDRRPFTIIAPFGRLKIRRTR